MAVGLMPFLNVFHFLIFVLWSQSWSYCVGSSMASWWCHSDFPEGFSQQSSPFLRGSLHVGAWCPHPVTVDFQFFLRVESWVSQAECFEPSLSCLRMCTVSAYFQASTLPGTSFLFYSFCSGSSASMQFIPVIATMSSNCSNKWLKLITSTNATRIKIKMEQAWIRVNC